MSAGEPIQPQSAAEILREIASKATMESSQDSTISFLPDEGKPAPEIANPETGIAITRHLSVPLDDKRKAELADEVANHINLYKQLEKLKTDSVATYGKSMKQHRAEAESLSEMISNGIEMKLVPCRKHIDYVKGRVLVIRLDNNTVLEDKALEEEDMKQ